MARQGVWAWAPGRVGVWIGGCVGALEAVLRRSVCLCHIHNSKGSCTTYPSTPPPPPPPQVMAKMLPRHMEIIEIINEGWGKWLTAHLAGTKEEVATKIAAMSIVHENQWNKDEMWVPQGHWGGDGHHQSE